MSLLSLFFSSQYIRDNNFKIGIPSDKRRQQAEKNCDSPTLPSLVYPPILTMLNEKKNKESEKRNWVHTHNVE